MFEPKTAPAAVPPINKSRDIRNYGFLTALGVGSCGEPNAWAQFEVPTLKGVVGYLYLVPDMELFNLLSLRLRQAAFSRICVDQKDAGTTMIWHDGETWRAEPRFT